MSIISEYKIDAAILQTLIANSETSVLIDKSSNFVPQVKELDEVLSDLSSLDIDTYYYLIEPTVKVFLNGINPISFRQQNEDGISMTKLHKTNFLI